MSEIDNQSIDTVHKAVIFDFDGTIADSFEIFVETIAELLNRQPLSSEEIEHLRGASVSEIEKYFQIKPWQKPAILLKGRQEIAKKMDRVSLFEGMNDVMKTLSQQERMIYILSSNSSDSIQAFLDKNDISSYVSSVHGGVSITGKAGHLKKLLKHENLKPDEAVYVGDEVRDLEATQKVGMQCISVAWGYSTLASLEEHNPSAIVSSPTELAEKF